MAAPVVVRVRPTPGGTDAYGDPIAGSEDRLTLTGAATAPRTSGDVDARGRAGVIVGLTLFAPYDADITYTDRIEVDGVLYEIDGEPGRWRNPFTGWEPGMQVALVRASG